jgi:sarcosine oxidase/L-pipecolate oxidase
MCWFADTADSDYTVDFVPNTGDSLVVLSGDSGHGFKMMPIVGEWVVKLLEDGRQVLPRWQWRGGSDEKRGKEWGDDVSWRIGTTREIREVIDEQDKAVRARL